MWSGCPPVRHEVSQVQTFFFSRQVGSFFSFVESRRERETVREFAVFPPTPPDAAATANSKCVKKGAINFAHSLQPAHYSMVLLLPWMAPAPPPPTVLQPSRYVNAFLKGVSVSFLLLLFLPVKTDCRTLPCVRMVINLSINSFFFPFLFFLATKTTKDKECH
jgi:hypothetical protein